VGGGNKATLTLQRTAESLSGNVYRVGAGSGGEGLLVKVKVVSQSVYLRFHGP